MIRLIVWLLLLGAALNANAQILTPVKWNFSAVNVSESEVQLVFTASLDETWHIYSQFIGKDGPLPTTFTFTPSPYYTRIGKVQETSTPIKSYDKTFMMNIVWFARTATFVQKVKLRGPVATVDGVIEFMACTGETCLPPDEVSFSIRAVAERPVKIESGK